MQQQILNTNSNRKTIFSKKLCKQHKTRLQNSLTKQDKTTYQTSQVTKQIQQTNQVIGQTQ